MDNNLSGEENDDIDWDTEDELEIQEIQDTTVPACMNLRTTVPAVSGDWEASSSSVPFQSKFIQQFIVMGFPEESIAKAIEQNGENSELVLDTLLTFKALEDSSEEQPSASPQLEPCISSDDSSSEYYENLLDDVYEEDSWSSDSDHLINSATQCYLRDNNSSLSQKDQTLLSLVNMGYPREEASIAMERCPGASLPELADFMYAAQMARAEDPYLPEDIKPKLNNISGGYKKRKMYSELCKRKKQAIFDEETIRLPKPMIGFGVPTESFPAVVQRTLPEQAKGPPFFYYENVALAPKGVWDIISRNLYGIEPEFVDSKYFCAAARKRGYIHNLPIENRFPLLPLPPRTINEALPLTKKWWPSWDHRTKLNCLQTAYGSARLTDRIRKAVEDFDDGEPPERVQKYVLEQCRKWNLVWVGRNKVAILEPDEVEMLLGFPKNHTRGGGISRTDRYKSLGNSFQVDTVAYHLSVLKDLFPNGINVLSLFSGIGGAEVALYRLGIRLKNVVSVEKSEVNRNIVRSWWEQTNQRGNLIDFDDVQQLNGDRLEQLIDSFGGFDLIIGGSPCNNLAGSNRVSRDGLEGQESSLFYHYPRILGLVKDIMARYRM